LPGSKGGLESERHGGEKGQEERGDAASEMSLLDFLEVEAPKNEKLMSKEGKEVLREGLTGSIVHSLPKTLPEDRKGVVALDPPLPEDSKVFPSNTKKKFDSFSACGISPEVSSALENAGFQRPTNVQAKAIPTILPTVNPKQDHVIIAGPTGSGKTLAYLGPILSELLRAPESWFGENKPARQRGLILCPNVALARQAYAVLDAILQNSPEGHPIRKLRASIIESDADPISPFNLGHIIVSSTAQFLKYAEFDIKSKSHHKALIGSVDFVVLDEADLQISGSYQNEFRHLVSYIRQQNINHPSKDYQRSDFSKYLLINFLKLQNSPQFIFAAATLPDNSPKSAGSVLRRALPYARWVHAEFLHQTLPSVKFIWALLPEDSNEDLSTSVVNQPIPTTDSVEVSNSEDAEDTMQSFDDSYDMDDSHEDIEKIHDPEIIQNALKRVPEIIEALRSGPPRAIVFCNKIGSADIIANALNQQQGIRAEAWHREIGLASRQDLLDKMRLDDLPQDAKDDILCLVCTDAAARGIDLPRVGHVIQAEFAGNAVDFLHRVGRTGRLGREGKVTSIVDTKSKDLATFLQTAIERGEPVEATFSRKRSFRKNINRRAERVARGENTGSSSDVKRIGRRATSTTYGGPGSNHSPGSYNRKSGGSTGGSGGGRGAASGNGRGASGNGRGARMRTSDSNGRGRWN